MVATEQSARATGSSPACAVPGGTAHAVDTGAASSRCGLAVVDLSLWPELTWPPSGMAAVDECPACAAG